MTVTSEHMGTQWDQYNNDYALNRHLPDPCSKLAKSANICNKLLIADKRISRILLCTTWPT